MQLFNPKSKVRVQCIPTFLCTFQVASELAQTIHILGKDWENHSFIHSFICSFVRLFIRLLYKHCACPMVAKIWEYSDKNVVPLRFYDAVRGWNYPRSVQDSMGGYNEMPPGWFTDRNTFSFRCGGWRVLDHSVDQFLAGGVLSWLPACPVWTLWSPLFLLWGALTPSWEAALMASS